MIDVESDSDVRGEGPTVLGREPMLAANFVPQLSFLVPRLLLGAPLLSAPNSSTTTTTASPPSASLSSSSSLGLGKSSSRTISISPPFIVLRSARALDDLRILILRSGGFGIGWEEEDDGERRIDVGVIATFSPPIVEVELGPMLSSSSSPPLDVTGNGANVNLDVLLPPPFPFPEPERERVASFR